MKHILPLIFLWMTACTSSKENNLQTTFINPASGYTQVVVSEYNGLKTIHISGQIGEGEDLETQMKNALLNIEKQLKDVGADFSDIVKMNHYIVDYQAEQLATFRNTRKEIMGNENMPASTLVGVTALFSPEYLIEIDAIAIVEAE